MENTKDKEDTTMSAFSGDLASLEDEEIVCGYGNYQDKTSKVFYKSGTCYLKTKTDRFKEHWAVHEGSEIYFYRTSNDTEYRVMHSLAATFVKSIDTEKCPDSNKRLYPIKIILPPNKSRILYFPSDKARKEWMTSLESSIGANDLFKYYELRETLGKG
jgi:hypothetical protein